jgi:hypothetical protein
MIDSSDFSPLTDAQIEKITERAADKAVAKMTANFYMEVGKGFINKIFFVAGVIVVSVLAWWYGKTGG